MIRKPFAVRGLAALMLAATAKAGVYKIGDDVSGFKAPDQHGAEFTFTAGSAKSILFMTPGESGAVNPPTDPNWFKKHQALLVVNVSDMSAIKRGIGKSRLEAKPFRLMVIGDKATAGKFPIQNGRVTVLSLGDKGKITAIRFATPGKELQGLFP